MDTQQKIVTAALATILIIAINSAFAGEPGSTEPNYDGTNYDLPMYGDKDEPGVGPGVPTNDHNLQIGDWANENAVEESIDLVHASDTNI